jgi:ribosomal protein S18 acetylase RimI-like enzyme
VSQLHYRINGSRAQDIAAHLIACDGAFTPPLSSRVAIPTYAAQLAQSAQRFEAWAEGDLVGLVATYCNSPEMQEAFVSNVSVALPWTRRGVARRLMQDAIGHAQALGFARIALSVDGAAPALGLYRALGFSVEARSGETLRLSLDLAEGGP